jgi:hypothetical protein
MLRFARAVVCFAPLRGASEGRAGTLLPFRQCRHGSQSPKHGSSDPAPRADAPRGTQRNRRSQRSPDRHNLFTRPQFRSYVRTLASPPRE